MSLPLVRSNALGLARVRYINLEKVNLKAIAYNLTRAANVYKDLITP
ncbi:hypothetical protein [Bathymodiolus heckerae thiotrophic gill symbiont]|nr:hypothetical protein [Bathymodiolus heckerae thiotrophic gill symbiont]